MLLYRHLAFSHWRRSLWEIPSAFFFYELIWCCLLFKRTCKEWPMPWIQIIFFLCIVMATSEDLSLRTSFRWTVILMISQIFFYFMFYAFTMHTNQDRKRKNEKFKISCCHVVEGEQHLQISVRSTLAFTQSKKIKQNKKKITTKIKKKKSALDRA